ncbi:MAG: NTP transferase domain-containing protein [Spirochaetes bacterium]|nr:NTP transferase domain-containing protein [Spirochaetota bacterium]MBU1080973.1 NTP transferase domain-containing protein [Spirochaetota bacterium]
MAGPTLVVMAAGMGSRYGGVKQIDRVGRAGETLLHYSVYDAVLTGFSRVVFVVRRSIAEDFEETVTARLPGSIDRRIAYQELDSLVDPASAERARNAGRSKPWGTAHAVLCAREEIPGPFAVINADDFYGREAFASMAAFLSGPRAAGPGGEAAIVPYRLDSTLSPSGPVARGVCGIDGGYLRSVVERYSIERRGDRVVCDSGDGQAMELAGGAPVSMNFWGFPRAALGGLASYFESFLAERSGEPSSEAQLPTAVEALTSSAGLRVRALEPGREWFGMTYREDRESAAARISELVAAGVYPSPLWDNA